MIFVNFLVIGGSLHPILQNFKSDRCNFSHQIDKITLVGGKVDIAINSTCKYYG